MKITVESDQNLAHICVSFQPAVDFSAAIKQATQNIQATTEAMQKNEALNTDPEPPAPTEQAN